MQEDSWSSVGLSRFVRSLSLVLHLDYLLKVQYLWLREAGWRGRLRTSLPVFLKPPSFRPSGFEEKWGL